MNNKIYRFLKIFRIVESCPNCDSAWTHPDPGSITFCIVCGDGPKGWVWRILPRFVRDRQIQKRLDILISENSAEKNR